MVRRPAIRLRGAEVARLAPSAFPHTAPEIHRIFRTAGACARAGEKKRAVPPRKPGGDGPPWWGARGPGAPGVSGRRSEAQAEVVTERGEVGAVDDPVA